MGNCCISSSDHKQLPSRPRQNKAKNVINGKEKYSPVPVTYVASGKASPVSDKRKQSFENGKSTETNRKSSFQQTDLKASSNTAQRSSSLSKSGVSEQKLESFFEKYKDSNEDSILADGTEKLCQDLKLDPTEFRILLLAWKFSVSQMCRFTKQEFMTGCKTLKVDSIRALQGKLAVLEQEVENKDMFRDLYRFTYGFGLDVEDGQRTLPTPVAVDLWLLVFSNRTPLFLQEWIDFLQEKQVKGISRDTWNMFLYLYETVKPDFSNYDESEAWPSLFDEFVAKRSENEQTENDTDVK